MELFFNQIYDIVNVGFGFRRGIAFTAIVHNTSLARFFHLRTKSAPAGFSSSQ